MFVARGRDAVHIGEERGSLREYSLHMRITLKLRTPSRSDRTAIPAGWGARRRLFVQTAHRAMCRRRGGRWGGHRRWQEVVSSRAEGGAGGTRGGGDGGGEEREERVDPLHHNPPWRG